MIGRLDGSSITVSRGVLPWRPVPHAFPPGAEAHWEKNEGGSR